MNRRVFLSMGSLGVLRFGALHPQTAQTAHTAQTAQTKTRARMHVGTQRGPTDDEMLMYFKRHGVDNICGYPPAEGEKGDWSVDVLSRFREQCSTHGVSLDMVQFPFMSSSHVDRAQRKGIMLGQEPERQQEIDEACEIIRNCRAAGIPAVKYNLSLISVLRTESTPGRGGTTYSTWRLAEALKEQRPLTRAGRVSADEMWERITYFLERVVPVAEEYKIRLACHPPRSRRAARRVQRRRQSSRHRRRDEAPSRDSRQPLPRPEPLPGHNGGNASGSCARDQRRHPLLRPAKEDLQHPLPEYSGNARRVSGSLSGRRRHGHARGDEDLE